MSLFHTAPSNGSTFACNVKDRTIGLLSLQCFSGALACEYNGGPSHDRHMVSHILYLITNTKIIYLSLHSH